MSVEIHTLLKLSLFVRYEVMANVAILLPFSSLSVEHLEPMLRQSYEEKTGHKQGKVFFNKGL